MSGELPNKIDQYNFRFVTLQMGCGNPSGCDEREQLYVVIFDKHSDGEEQNIPVAVCSIGHGDSVVEGLKNDGRGISSNYRLVKAGDWLVEVDISGSN